MRITYKNFLRATVCICLCFLMLWGMGLSGTAESRATADPFDYSLPALENKQSISASELFYRLYGVYPTELEKKYLDEHSEITLRYTDLIPQSIVSTDYNGDAGILQVSVPAYQYTAGNGTVVEWIPEAATLDGVEKRFSRSGDRYVCQFEDLLYSQDFDIYVSFVWNAELPAETVDLLLTKAYNAGNDALNTILDYEENLVKPYYEALERYEVYEAYRQALAAHDQYLADLSVYEQELAKYQAYTQAYAKFLEDRIAYEAYLQNKALWDQFYDYQEFMKTYKIEENAYLLYQSNLDKVLSKLAILESLFVTDSNNWTFYPSLMGNTVTAVTSRKNELIDAGCNETDILNADRATLALRTLLTGYSDLRRQTYASEHDKNLALYTYYTANYTALKENFALLYGSLMALYGNSFVVIHANNEGKLAHFQQFIGQLYVTVTCLDDSEKGIRMENWRISKKRLSEVVDPINLIPDTGNADPAGVVMPEKEVVAPQMREPVEKPSQLLSAVSKPVEPSAVTEPIAPTPVDSPDRENPPPKETHPGTLPAMPPMDDTLAALATAIREGTLPEREAQGESRGFAIRKTIVCPISIHNLKTVTFYDLDGETILYQQKVNYGESVSYGGPETYKSDPYYVYTFRGWVLSNGSTASFEDVRENLSIFADYKKEVRLYKVLWILDGVETESYHKYGEIPVPPVSVNKPNGVGETYRFTGWDKEISPIDGEAVYVGGFETIPNIYTVTWVTHQGQVTQRLTHGEIPYFSSSDLSYTDKLFSYTFVGWDKDILAPITGDRTFYAQYSKAHWATAKNGVPLEGLQEEKTLTIFAGNSDVVLLAATDYAKTHGLSLVIRWQDFSICYANQDLNTLMDLQCERITLRQKNENGGVLYTVGYQDAQARELNAKISASLIPYPLNEDGSGCVYAVPDGEGWRDLPEDSYAVSGNAKLLVKKAYRIIATGNENCNVSALPLYAVSGQWISIDLSCEFGYEIIGASLVYNGTSTAVKGLGFQMPEGDVSITLKVEPIVYHVTFTVDGEVYSQADYRFGESILLPKDPQKAQDDTYSYEFLEWSPTVTIAMGDDRTPTYEAVFSKNLLNGVDPYHSGNNNNALLNTYLPIGLAVLAVIIGVLVYLKRRKKRRLATEAKAE